jgi:hypothetical protein
MLRSFPARGIMMPGATPGDSPASVDGNFSLKGAFAVPFKRVGTILTDVSTDFSGKRMR